MGNKRILIIDDDVELCEELSETLKLEGYLTECVSGGAEGENMMRDRHFDIVILDYKMPGLSGIDVLKRMKAKSIKKSIIMISGKPFVEKMLEENGLSGFVSGIIAKPINFDSLLDILNNTPVR